MSTARPVGFGRARDRDRGGATGRRGFSARVAIPPDSPLEAPFLRPTHVSEDLHLRLESDTETLMDLLARLRHDVEDVRGGRPSGVLDEVGVLRRQPGSADLQAPAAGGIEQLAGRATVSSR